MPTQTPDLPAIFQPIGLRDLSIRNRIWVSPMCQYAVEGRAGVPQAWHSVHYGSFAIGGFGLIISEATAVVPEGRISPWDTGLWDEQQVVAWRGITDFVHAQGAAMGVQLAHAGRKASTNRGWPGYPPKVLAQAEGGWPVVGPTSEPADGAGNAQPVHALTEQEILGVVQSFADAAIRAVRAGFDVVEIHAAHGYLLHQFSSPLSNTRSDGWGGGFQGRTRLLLEVVRAVRRAWPANRPVFVRISAVDWVADGWTIEDSIRLCRILGESGVDLVDVSTGGLVRARIPVAPGYQVQFAERIRREAAIPTAAVGMITTAAQAEQLVAAGSADAVLLGRAALRDTNWPLRAAHELRVAAEDAPWQPARWRGHWQ